MLGWIKEVVKVFTKRWRIRYTSEFSRFHFWISGNLRMQFKSSILMPISSIPLYPAQAKPNKLNDPLPITYSLSQSLNHWNQTPSRSRQVARMSFIRPAENRCDKISTCRSIGSKLQSLSAILKSFLRWINIILKIKRFRPPRRHEKVSHVFSRRILQYQINLL